MFDVVTGIRWICAPERLAVLSKIIQYNVSWTIARSEQETKEYKKNGLIPHEDPVNRKQARREAIEDRDANTLSVGLRLGSMPFRVTSLSRTTSPKRISVGLPDVTRQPQRSWKGAVETEIRSLDRNCVLETKAR
jgi:hypothetical protein